MKIIFFANTDWYLFNFRLGLAKFLRQKGCEVVMMSPPGEYGPRFAEKDFHWISLPMNRRSLNPVRELKLVREIRNIFKTEAPDAVHSFTIKSVVYGALAAQFAGIDKRINSITGLGHTFISSSWRARALRTLVRQLLRKALRGRQSYLILQNSDDQRLFEDLGMVSGDHVRLIKGSGVDTDLFLPAGHGSGSEFRVLLASRLLWEKGIQTYVEAAELVQGRRNNVKFMLAGVSDPGNPSAISDEVLADWEQRGLVEILGHVEDMVGLMRGVDLVVLPSRREGVPRSLIEAAAMQLPIITSDVPGCREIVDDGVNGLLVPVDDAEALACSVETLADNPGRCREFGVAGREKVLREFEQNLVFSKTVDVYREAGLNL